MRVFIIESPNPKDLLDSRSEREPLEYICNAMGHNVYSFLVKSARELGDTCKYISSFYEGSDDDPEEPLCIHLSCHGSNTGLQFGTDRLNWKKVAEHLEPILKMNYQNDLFLVISACGTDKQRITTEIQKLSKVDNKIKPPKYVIVFDQNEVSWDDAILTWTILYHQIDKIDHNNNGNVKGLLDRIKGSRFGNLTYRRWSKKNKIFLKYAPDDPVKEE
ncbi:hypothetical protein MH215_10370 [Paenibacillus sp. ACRSA]|uniref:hypothetical protein n=1 Tax=Paenibacillus sp. ACRSA TaxID=2918211 RepID=UPI001EF3DE4E|nr:hypothetical protein [Paenibacillus sp. ACRSA]MCG7377400.1 hypothetical protein [Paenibacillus sp. ACRSA]